MLEFYESATMEVGDLDKWKVEGWVRLRENGDVVKPTHRQAYCGWVLELERRNFD